MNAKKVAIRVAAGAALLVSANAFYQLTEDRIKLSLAERRERKLREQVARLQQQIDKDAMKMVIRFEKA